MKREDKINVKENEIALNFSEKFLLEGIYEIPSPKGGTYDAYGIVIPDEDYSENDVKRVFLVNVRFVHKSKNPKTGEIENGRYTFLLRDHEYPINYADGFTEDGQYILKKSYERMPGEEIVESFKRYRAALARKFEQKFIPKKEDA